MTEENKNDPCNPDFHRTLISKIAPLVQQPVPFHSDLHREVALWLQNNRHLSSEERILEVATLMFKYGMTTELLIHYAASSFITLDAWDKFRNEQLLEVLSVAGARNIKSGKDIANHQKAKKAVNARHDKPGGSRDKAAQIRAIWATGKYTTRDICAEEEYQDIGYTSFSTARKALRNTPNPEKPLSSTQ